jgi:hypothetical protein
MYIHLRVLSNLTSITTFPLEPPVYMCVDNLYINTCMGNVCTYVCIYTYVMGMHICKYICKIHVHIKSYSYL